MEFYNFKTTIIYVNRVGFPNLWIPLVICHIYGTMENPHVFSYIYILVANIWQTMWYFQKQLHITSFFCGALGYLGKNTFSIMEQLLPCQFDKQDKLRACLRSGGQATSR